MRNIKLTVAFIEIFDRLKIDVEILNRSRKKIGGKWKPMVMVVLLRGPRRFNKIKQLLPGVSGYMLTLSLRQMEANGIIIKRESRYHLTTPGSRISALTNEINGIVATLP